MNLRFSVLLLGNAHVIFNDLAARMTDMGLSVASCAANSAFLSDHAAYEGSCIEAHAWDVVVLQEDVAIAMNDKGRKGSRKAVKALAKRIRANSAKTRVLVMETWARKAGMPPYHNVYSMQQSLLDDAVFAAESVDGEAVLVGSTALKYHWDTGNTIWKADGENPAVVTSNIAALVLYRAITHANPPSMPRLYAQLEHSYFT